ncbi:hypothetical protein V8E53_006194 [Lactarius tabidus]
MPNDVEKESRWARRQRKWEEKRQRRNEQRLEGQRREYERQCEALRKKAAAVEEGDAAPRAQNESKSGETRVEQWGDKDLEEPQPPREEAAAAAASRSDGQRKRPRKPKRGNRRRAEAKAEMNASPVPAKNEHPELHVIAQLTPLAPPSPPLTPSSLSGKGETWVQDEDFRTMEADYLFDPPLRRAAPAPPPPTEPESAQTREAAADVLFDPQFQCVEQLGSSDSAVAAVVPIVVVKIGRASAAFYRNKAVAEEEASDGMVEAVEPH